MSRRIKFTIFFCSITFFLIFLGFLAHQATLTFKRSPADLLNQYYMLEKKNPKAAKRALEILLEQQPNNEIARRELGYHYLNTSGVKNVQNALEQTEEINPTEKTEPLSAQNATANPMNLLNLFTQYYAIKEKNPIAAQILLYQIIQFYPNSSLAYSELGYLEIAQNDKTHALLNLKKSFALEPNAQVAAQIGYLLVDARHLTEARAYFEKAYVLGDTAVQQEIKLIFSQLTFIMLPHTASTSTAMSEHDRLMNEFYALKAKHPTAAWQLLQKIIKLYPNDINALKEAGYMSLAKLNYKQALPYFQKAYNVTHDPVLALQAGYISSTIGNQPQAYGYFEDATTAVDEKLAQKAQQAMTNIGGLQTKVIPYPFFIDFYYAPFFFSRFALIVNPVIVRAGITLNQAHNVQLYLIYRYTRDNRSAVGGQISQIYQDDTGIGAMGINFQPFVKIPLVLFAQVGKAYNLLNEHPRWRNDVRAGSIFYDQWGVKPIFSPELEFPFAWFTTLYSNVGYYSRYANDVIADNRLREGFRVLRYKPSAIDIYLDEHVVLDSQQQFYNNILEVGPGVVFYPSNRYNLDLRLESLKGFYLPVSSPSPNPYGPTYRNNEILFETYMTI